MTLILSGIVLIILTGSIASMRAPLSCFGLLLGWAGCLTGMGLIVSAFL